MVSVLYTHFDKPLSLSDWNKLLFRLPENLHGAINRFVRWQDRHSSLFGKLLLLEGLKLYGLPPDKLKAIKFNRYKRPYLVGDFDFNISHSGEYVVCGVSDEGDIGIDIEKIHDIEIAHFQQFFPQDQWRWLQSIDFNLYEFFRLWTKIESVIKWEGSGMYVGIDKVSLKGENAEVGGKGCHVKEVFIERDYPCFFSTGNKTNNFITEEYIFGRK
ncbi:MAG: 4'-phosphopantetheinyl transferase superfamily protein [Candidatus Electryoneaceae bacterium]|nr:4'-phosphopantetheinyl transferase superfamily protein [Candidatus Electryoneaceae bacterium]